MKGFDISAIVTVGMRKLNEREQDAELRESAIPFVRPLYTDGDTYGRMLHFKPRELWHARCMPVDWLWHKELSEDVDESFAATFGYSNWLVQIVPYYGAEGHCNSGTYTPQHREWDARQP